MPEKTKYESDCEEYGREEGDTSKAGNSYNLNLSSVGGIEQILPERNQKYLWYKHAGHQHDHGQYE